MGGGRVEIILPLPPSANNLTRKAPRKGGKFYPTKAYSDWTSQANAMALEAGLIPRRDAPFQRPVHVRVDILPGKGLRMDRDADNLAKAVQDWLVKWDFLIDDCLRYVHGTHVVYRPQEASPTGYAAVRVSFTEQEA
jgi:Holliday junction resolvase RusA-like endonuclease